jgi:hypothetical protein
MMLNDNKELFLIDKIHCRERPARHITLFFLYFDKFDLELSIKKGSAVNKDNCLVNSLFNSLV